MTDEFDYSTRLLLTFVLAGVGLRGLVALHASGNN